MPNLYKVQDHRRDLLGRSMASHTMPWLGSMFFPMHTILVLHQNLLLFFCPSYVAAQKASVAPRVSATRQVIQTDGLTSSSSLITKARRVRIIMPQSFRPLNTKKKHTLLARGEETTTSQAIRASNSRVPGVHVHKENTQFSIDQLMECQLQMLEVVQKLVNTPLFSF